jgi:hypothetical protein
MADLDDLSALPWWFHRWAPDAARRSEAPPTPDGVSIRAHAASLGFVPFDYHDLNPPPRSRLLDRIRAYIRSTRRA